MARNKGIIQLQGTVGGLTFKRDGTISQAVGSRPVTAERTKENNTEFAIAAKQAKVIRDALRGLDVGDRFVAGRMVKVVRSGVALDPDNERGKRILSNNEAKQVLPKFELNGNADVTSVAPLAWVVAGEALIITKIGGRGADSSGYLFSSRDYGYFGGSAGGSGEFGSRCLECGGSELDGVSSRGSRCWGVECAVAGRSKLADAGSGGGKVLPAGEWGAVFPAERIL